MTVRSSRPQPRSPARCSRRRSTAPAASCSTSPAAVDLGLFEVNEAAEIIHGVAHPDANIIFGAVIDDEMGDEVRVTVIAAGFERWDGPAPSRIRGRTPVDAREDGSGDLFAGRRRRPARQRRRLRRPVVPEVGVGVRPAAAGGPVHRPHRRHQRGGGRPRAVGVPPDAARDASARGRRSAVDVDATRCTARRSSGVDRPGDGAGSEADAAATAVPGRGARGSGRGLRPRRRSSARAAASGIAHVGWRGLAGGVLPATIATMRTVGAWRSDRPRSSGRASTRSATSSARTTSRWWRRSPVRESGRARHAGRRRSTS